MTALELATGLASKQPAIGVGSLLQVGGIGVVSHVADRALVSGSGGILSSGVTALELAHVAGATSSLQMQLDALEATGAALGSGKQDVIADDHLAISHVVSLQRTLDTLQPAVTTGSLDISHVEGLQESLDAKQATIGNADIAIAHVAGLNEAFGNFIPWGSIEITDVSGLQARLNSVDADMGARVLSSTLAASLLDYRKNSDPIEITHVTGLSDSIAAATSDLETLGGALTTKLGTTEASALFHPVITNDSLPLSSVMGLVTHVLSTASALASLSSGLDLKSDITDVSAIQSSIGNLETSKQDVIADDHLAISHVVSLQSRLDGLQPTVTAGSLDISHVAGLQAGLDAKQATIGNDDIDISHVAGLSEAFENFITWGSIDIPAVSGLQAAMTALGESIGALAKGPTSKQDLIDELPVAKVSGLQASLDSKLDVKSAASTYQTAINSRNQIQMTSVTGLVESSSGVYAATAALEARVAAVEGRSIVSTYSLILNTVVSSSINLNQALLYHRYAASSTNSAVTYESGSSMFRITQPGDYSISANFYVADGLANERATLFMACRVYASSNRSGNYYDHVMGSAYYRDDLNHYDSFNMGGCIRVYVSSFMAAIGCSFEICSMRIDAQDTTRTLPATAALSKLKIERLVNVIG